MSRKQKRYRLTRFRLQVAAAVCLTAARDLRDCTRMVERLPLAEVRALSQHPLVRANARMLTALFGKGVTHVS